MTRLVDWPARRPLATIVLVGVLSLIAYTVSLAVFRKPGGRIVMGDAVHYYVYLRSALFDGDLQFRNDYVRLYGLDGGEPGTEWIYEPTATGHTRNMMAIGTPLAWVPLFLVAAGMGEVARAAGAPIAIDGYGRVFQATAGWSGIIAAVIGVWLTYRLAEQMFGPRAAIWAVLVQWIGSNAIYYSAMSPTYSHATSMLVVSAFFFYWARTLDRQDLTRYAIVGFLGGVVTLVRWQDAVFLIVPVVDAAMHAGTADRAGMRRAFRRAFVNLSVLCAAALVAFAPQIAVWQVLYGTWVAMPQGPEWMQWGTPHVWNILFSSWRGLFTWTPVVALGVIGLAPLARQHRIVGVACIAAFLVSVYANAAVAEWWAGEAFGHRRFVSCFPIFVLGTAALFDRLARRPGVVAAIVVTAIALNGLLLLQYQLFMHGERLIAPYPKTWHALLIERFLVPFRLLARLFG